MSSRYVYPAAHQQHASKDSYERIPTQNGNALDIMRLFPIISYKLWTL